MEEDEETAVYVVSDGAVTRRIVEMGISSGSQVEILGGLAEGEEIVVVGQSGLRDGSKVLASSRLAESFAG